MSGRISAFGRFFADGGYAGPKLEAIVTHLNGLAIEIIRRSDARRFVVLPRRWVVERTIAWLNCADAWPRTGRRRSLLLRHGLSSLPSGE